MIVNPPKVPLPQASDSLCRALRPAPGLARAEDSDEWQRRRV